MSRKKIRRLVEQEMEALGIRPTREKIEELVETRLRDESAAASRPSSTKC